MSNYIDGPAESNGYDDPDDPEINPTTGKPYDAPRFERGALVIADGRDGRVLSDDGITVRVELYGARIRDYATDDVRARHIDPDDAPAGFHLRAKRAS